MQPNVGLPDLGLPSLSNCANRFPLGVSTAELLLIGNSRRVGIEVFL